MYYRKPKILILLFVLAELTVTSVAAADSASEDSGAYFKGPMATCLSKAKVVFPCVSLSPPAYQTKSIFITDTPIGANLPLDSEKHESSNWLTRLRDGAFWSGEGLFSGDMQDIGMNFSLEKSSPGMKMNLGPMKFNLYVDEGNFSESRFFLGIDRSW